MFNLDLVSEDSKVYYRGHADRFKYQEELFRSLTDVKTAYDIGTWYPFASHAFTDMGAIVTYGCELEPMESIVPNAKHILWDLKNPPPLPQADFVMCCECLEHLPYNLIKVREYLVGLVKKGGYLFLSFPTGSIKHGEWDAELPEIDDKRHTHLREFPVEMARKFCNETGFTILSERSIKVPLYCHADGIWHILMRNDK
jgi:SAM-dependent methyltransferase